jgi:hypothetical protein
MAGDKTRRLSTLERRGGVVWVRCRECGQRWRTTERELEEHWAWSWQQMHEYPYLLKAIEEKNRDLVAGLLNLYHKEILADLSPTYVSLVEHKCGPP